MRRLLLAASLAVLATPARAESPKWGSFQFSISWYRPSEMGLRVAGNLLPSNVNISIHATLSEVVCEQ